MVLKINNNVHFIIILNKGVYYKLEKIKDKKQFFDILLDNSSKELEEFLLSKGKGPKAICPIMFIKEEKEKEDI